MNVMYNFPVLFVHQQSVADAVAEAAHCRVRIG